MISRRIESLFPWLRTRLESLQLHSLLLKTSLDHHHYYFSQFILSTSSVSLHYARKFFDSSPITPQPIFAWNTLIRAYSNNSSTPSESIVLFRDLLGTPASSGLKADNFTFPFVIKACGRCSMLGVGGSVHSMILKAGFGSDYHVNNTLLTMYGVCGVVGFCRKVFDEMCERDVVSWSSMIAAYVDSNLDLDALRTFRDMQMANKQPNLVTFISLLAACTNLLNNRLGKCIHSHIIINGVELHVGLGTALVKMYAKSGLLRDAFHVFNSIEEKNLQSWTVMITCLAENGCGEEAIFLFDKMEKTGLRPDSVSFSAILSACSHRGLLLEGRELFEKMATVYSIEPTVEHYGCMVDLLGRAGKIEEAYQIISSMPMEPNAVILRSYLSACKHHGRVVYADEYLMQFLLKTEPDIGANYVLAASVMSMTGYWNGTGNMRTDMKLKGVKKVPGCSWVQLRSY